MYQTQGYVLILNAQFYLSVAAVVSATELLLYLNAQQSEMITSDYNLHISFSNGLQKNSQKEDVSLMIWASKDACQTIVIFID